MRKILECIVSQKLADNKKYILATIVNAKGSTPRKVGAMMLVGEEGILEGTIGGGILEHECMHKALQLPLEESGCIETYVLDNSKAESLGMICGGSTEVLFTVITREIQELAKQALDKMYNHKGGYWCIWTVENRMSLETEECEQCISLSLISERRVFLMGGGHVAMEVARLLDYLGFRYVILDDREEFATRERFLGAEEVVVSSFEKLNQNMGNYGLLPITDKDGFCILTRGHVGDTSVLRFALDTNASYIGAMGSRRKSETILRMLEEEGFQEVKERVTTPIGMDIGAQTPEELAVSIVGELIKWRAGRI